MEQTPLVSRRIALSLTLLALFALVGCSGEESTPTEETATVLISTTPRDGSTVPEGATITLFFDTDPREVKVNGSVIEGMGATREFRLHSPENAVTWPGGSVTLRFVLTVNGDEAPELVDTGGDSTQEPGVWVMDAADAMDNGITLEFSEDIDRAILVVAVNGNSLGWIVSVDGSTVTLLPGDPVIAGFEYEVIGRVTDASGNETDIELTYRME